MGAPISWKKTCAVAKQKKAPKTAQSTGYTEVIHDAVKPVESKKKKTVRKKKKATTQRDTGYTEVIHDAVKPVASKKTKKKKKNTVRKKKKSTTQRDTGDWAQQTIAASQDSSSLPQEESSIDGKAASTEKQRIKRKTKKCLCLGKNRSFFKCRTCYPCNCDPPKRRDLCKTCVEIHQKEKSVELQRHQRKQRDQERRHQAKKQAEKEHTLATAEKSNSKRELAK